MAPTSLLRPRPAPSLGNKARCGACAAYTAPSSPSSHLTGSRLARYMHCAAPLAPALPRLPHTPTRCAKGANFLISGASAALRWVLPALSTPYPPPRAPCGRALSGRQGGGRRGSTLKPAQPAPTIRRKPRTTPSVLSITAVLHTAHTPRILAKKRGSYSDKAAFLLPRKSRARRSFVASVTPLHCGKKTQVLKIEVFISPPLTLWSFFKAVSLPLHHLFLKNLAEISRHLFSFAPSFCEGRRKKMFRSPRRHTPNVEPLNPKKS